MDVGEGSRTDPMEQGASGPDAPSGPVDEEALLDEAIRQADQRLTASLQKDELRRRRRRWWVLGGFAMTITIVGVVSAMLLYGAGKAVTPADARKAAGLANRGWQLYLSEEFAEAAEKLEAAVELDPGISRAWNGLGWSWFRLGQSEAAVEAFEKCIALEVDHAAARNGLGHICFNRGQYDQAESHWILVADEAPGTWGGLAKLYLLQGKFDQAARWAEKLTKEVPDDEFAKRLLAAARAKRLDPKLRKEIEPSRDEAGKASTSFLIKDGFESGKEVPEGWESGLKIPGVSYVWAKKTAFEGKASLCLRKTAKRYFPIGQWSRSVPHNGEPAKLEVAAQVKAEQMTKAVIDVQFMDARRRMLRHEWAAYIGAKKASDPPVDHDWKRYTAKVAVPKGADELVIALQIYGPGTVWFDNVTARYVGKRAGQKGKKTTP